MHQTGICIGGNSVYEWVSIFRAQVYEWVGIWAVHQYPNPSLVNPEYEFDKWFDVSLSTRYTPKVRGQVLKCFKETPSIYG